MPVHQERARYLQTPAISGFLCVCLHSSVGVSRKVNRYLKAEMLELFVAAIIQISPNQGKRVCVIEQFQFHVPFLAKIEFCYYCLGLDGAIKEQRGQGNPFWRQRNNCIESFVVAGKPGQGLQADNAVECSTAEMRPSVMQITDRQLAIGNRRSQKEITAITNELLVNVHA